MQNDNGRGRRPGSPQTTPRAGMRTAGALAAALVVAALLAACSGGGDPPPISKKQATYQDMLAYSQCMRTHGEPAFPDPQPDGNLLVNGQHLNGALMNSANKACQHLMPKIKPMTAAQQRKVTAQALKFVACMRTHGIPNMPDPVVNAQGIELHLGGPGHSGPAPNSAVLRAAQQACQKLLPGSPP